MLEAAALEERRGAESRHGQALVGDEFEGLAQVGEGFGVALRGEFEEQLRSRTVSAFANPRQGLFGGLPGGLGGLRGSQAEGQGDREDEKHRFRLSKALRQ